MLDPERNLTVRRVALIGVAAAHHTIIAAAAPQACCDPGPIAIRGAARRREARGSQHAATAAHVRDLRDRWRR